MVMKKTTVLINEDLLREAKKAVGAQPIRHMLMIAPMEPLNEAKGSRTFINLV